MRAILSIIAAVTVLFGIEHSGQGTVIYRYEWVPYAYLGNTTPTPLGNPFSGFIDFLAPTNVGFGGVGLSAIFDLQFTGAEGVDYKGVSSTLPPYTYTLSDAVFYPSVPLLWNTTSISFMALSLFDPAAAGSNAILTSHFVQTGLPLPYWYNEISQQGSWLYTGSLDRKAVPETGGNAVILMLSGAALAIFHLAARRRRVTL